MFVESVLVHMSVSASLALLLACIVGQLNSWIAVTSLILATLLTAVYRRSMGRPCADESASHPQTSPPQLRRISGAIGDFDPRQLTFPVWCLLLFLAFVVFRHSLYLLYFHDGWWKTLHPNNLGDLPLHMTYIKFFSAGNAFPPANPYYMSEALRYPMAMDLYNALWDKLGMPMMTHLFLVGVLSFITIFLALYRWAGPWAWAAVFFNGGYWSWDFWAHELGSSGASDLAWKNLFLSVLLTQRGFLFALPAGLVILHRGFEACFRSRPLTASQLWLYGWLWGILPFFHLHTFLAVSLLLGLWALLQKKVRDLLPMAVGAAFVAVPFLLYSTNFMAATGALRFKLGWTRSEGENIILYWWKNFGPWSILLLLMAFEVWRGKLRSWRIYFIAALALLMSTQLVLFAPWDWDNIKVMIWSYLAFIPLLELWCQMRLQPWQRDTVLAILFISGALSVGWSLRTEWPGVKLYAQEELNIVEQIVPKVPANSIFATADTFQHPVSYFGYGIALGFAGHLWSHGIESYEVRDAVDKIMKGDADWRVLAGRLGITHIYWGAREREKYGEQGQGWQQESNISPVPEVGIYELAKSPQ